MTSDRNRSQRRDALAPQIAPVVLANLRAQRPFHDAHLYQSQDTACDPFAAHPAFANSFDWHSSVHSHWTAAQLIGHDPAPAEEGNLLGELRAVLKQHLSDDRIRAEAQYLRANPSYERPYGWAWALMLAAAVPHRALVAMAAAIAERAIRWMNALPIPIRHGVHSNSAFALRLMLHAAEALQFAELDHAVRTHAMRWFADDRDWPVRWERSGHDFLSPALAEADLMRSVLPSPDFAAWWNGFVPNLEPGSPLLQPATVPNVDDGQIVHLHGLNLSRAAALARIARTLDRPTLVRAACALYEASVDRAVSGHYTETHWLPTFAWDAAVAIDEDCV
jgi:hypothetical protein